MITWWTSNLLDQSNGAKKPLHWSNGSPNFVFVPEVVCSKLKSGWGSGKFIYSTMRNPMTCTHRIKKIQTLKYICRPEEGSEIFCFRIYRYEALLYSEQDSWRKSVWNEVQNHAWNYKWHKVAHMLVNSSRFTKQTPVSPPPTPNPIKR